MLLTIVAAIVPVAVIIALGWFAGMRGIVDRNHTDSFVAFVLNFAVPALLFYITATADLKTLLNWPLVLTFSVGIMGVFAVIFAVQILLFRRDIKPATQAAFVCAFPDMVFIGIPVITVLVGSDAVVSVAIGNIITSVLLIPATTVLLELRSTSRRSALVVFASNFRAVIQKPQVVAPVLGVLFAVLGLKLPEPGSNTLKLLMETTAGVSLFALGMILSTHAITFSKAVLFNVGVKNLIQPAAMLGLLSVFGLSGQLADEIVLLCAMPTATITTMFAIRYDTLITESTSSTLLGTIVSMATLPMFMAIVGPVAAS